MNPIKNNNMATLTLSHSKVQCFLFATLLIILATAVVTTAMAVRSAHGNSLPKIFDAKWIKNLSDSLGKKGSIALLTCEIILGTSIIFYYSKSNAIKCSRQTKSIPFPQKSNEIALNHFFVDKTGDKNKEYFAEFLHSNEAIGLYSGDEIPKVTFIWKTASGKLNTSLCALPAEEEDSISVLASHAKRAVTHLVIPLSSSCIR